MNAKIILIILIIAFLCFPRNKKKSQDTSVKNGSSQSVLDYRQKRINDSILLEEFGKAEKEWKLSLEREKEEKIKREQKAAKDDLNSYNYKNSRNASLIDSLENRIKGLNKEISKSGKFYKKIEELSFDDQLTYLDSISKKNYRRRNEILQFYDKMYNIYNLEREKQVLILETQEGNDRGLVALHIKNTLEKLRKLNQEIIALKSTMRKKKSRK